MHHHLDVRKPVMRPKPLTSTPAPRYPTRREFLAGASTLAAVGLTGSGLVLADEAGGIAVAPIFEHGDGRGGTGCVVVAPPVFLTEEEALQTIREELGKHGITLKAGETLRKVLIPPRRRKIEITNLGNGKFTGRTLDEVEEDVAGAKPLELDGHDAKKKVAVEYVSRGEYFEVGGVHSGSTAQLYDFKEVARYVAGQAKKQGDQQLFLGVFYDPATIPVRVTRLEEMSDADLWAAWKEAEERGKTESKKLLRAQAEDFASWFKKQSAIP